jgi:hypothetical protein
MERRREHGAYAGIGLIIDGLLTFLFIPAILRIAGFLLWVKQIPGKTSGFNKHAIVKCN